MARITLYGKPGCHLCDQARAVVVSVCEELGVGWSELNLLDDPSLADLYWEQIPVTIVDGQVVGTLGVIGPQRMSYERMIQIVDVTAKLVSNALSHNK